MDIMTFLTFKNDITVKKLNKESELLFNSLFKNNKKIVAKKSTNILKNHKIQNNKEKISNKVNLILNKLSETNIDNLVINFIETINKVSYEDYVEIQKAFYIKLISEINFINIYLSFIKIISNLYLKVQEYNFSYFFSLLEYKFKSDYCNVFIEEYDLFFKDYNTETFRNNNLSLIYNIFNKELINECQHIILNQTKYLADIYYWYILKNEGLNEDEKIIISNLTKIKTNSIRDNVLLNNLLTLKIKAQPVKIEPELKVIDNTDKFEVECNNIIEEYFFIKSLDDIEYFISKKTTNIDLFCKYLIKYYFENNIEDMECFTELIKKLKTNCKFNFDNYKESNKKKQLINILI